MLVDIVTRGSSALDVCRLRTTVSFQPWDCDVTVMTTIYLMLRFATERDVRGAAYAIGYCPPACRVHSSCHP